MEQMTFVSACNKYFGRKEGQNLTEFQAELKELGPEDRAYFAREFRKIGIEIVAR